MIVVKNKKRDPMISIAKAIGIILMVVGHVYDKESWGVHFIYMFHMPLFFVLSGYFFKAPQNFTQLLKFTKKKIIGLYLPYLLWTILFVFLHNFLLKFGIGEQTYSWNSAIGSVCRSALTFVTTEKVLVGFWFLKALFSACIFLAIVLLVTRKIRLDIYQIAIVALLLVSLLISLDVFNKTLLGMFYGTCFLCVGFILRKYNIAENENGVRWILLLTCVVLLISRIYTEVSNTEMLSVDKMTYLPFAITGSCGSIMVILCSQKISSVKSFKVFGVFRYIGDHTLIILAMHYPLIKIFDFYFVQNVEGLNSLRLISGGVLGVLLPILFYKIYETVKKKILGK